jgi:hypothetical protein
VVELRTATVAFSEQEEVPVGHRDLLRETVLG